MLRWKMPASCPSVHVASTSFRTAPCRFQILPTEGERVLLPPLPALPGCTLRCASVSTEMAQVAVRTAGSFFF